MTVKNKKRRVWLTIFLGLLAALAPLSTDMYLPALPLMPNEFGVAASMVQLTLTATMAGMAIGQIFAGPISDMNGRRGPLFVGLLVFALSTLICVFATSIWVFLAFRFIQGFAGAVGIVIARAIARDVCEGPELTKFFSMLMLVNGLAPILAPIVGGQILLVASWRGIFAFLVCIGLVLTAASFIFKETLPTEKRIADINSSFKSFGRLLSDRYFLGHCLMQCFAFGAFFAYISGSSFVFQNIYGVSAQVYSGIFGGIGVAIMFGGALSGRLAGRVSDATMLWWSLVQAFMGSILLMGCFWCKAPLSIVLIALIFTIPTISVMGAASFSLAMRAHGKNAGSASALIGFFSMISGGVMAPLVGIAGSNNALPMAIIMLLGEAGALLFFNWMIAPAHRNMNCLE
ncbi:DHA1 family bicyclomycin/chloramphenicol resistance-like MFS transporter [Sporomusaceae bacterium BoRhaA]|uniref:multidrug effflux MFS transporter n=1 Tax=Pelorhabdus rhamnosifermentans TaxID=2772457 RepID=UPI001C06490D|nr:multidrug effflux MFS transporter [Pelorhabdus rhamnosifermentans]MBU2699335.1 DHA1 family bicyclomycin/chloramphenicol resistance-like MFS transporter [Pelorhabdus rhamnosifermentans]